MEREFLQRSSWSQIQSSASTLVREFLLKISILIPGMGTATKYLIQETIHEEQLTFQPGRRYHLLILIFSLIIEVSEH